MVDFRERERENEGGKKPTPPTPRGQSNKSIQFRRISSIFCRKKERKERNISWPLKEKKKKKTSLSLLNLAEEWVFGRVPKKSDFLFFATPEKSCGRRVAKGNKGSRSKSSALLQQRRGEARRASSQPILVPLESHHRLRALVEAIKDEGLKFGLLSRLL